VAIGDFHFHLSLSKVGALHERVLKDEIHVLLEQDDLKWRQRAKEAWLKNGDRKTKFFHACANQHARRNTISKIMDIHGKDCGAQEEVELAFVEYYQLLFTTSLSPNDVEYTHLVQQIVTHNMAHGLLANFTKEEINNALQQMGHLKALVPDGYISKFYQQHWETMGNEVCEAALYFFNSNKLDVVTNAT
jgi:hypothetical protein